MPDGFTTAGAAIIENWTQTPTPTQAKTIRPSLRCIREVVCQAYQVNALELCVDDVRPRVVAICRMIAWCASWHCHETEEIARLLHCDDGTVWVMVNCVDRLIETNPAFADRVIGIARLLPRVGG